ncbi:hypothetical protein BJX99DRAFT_1114 [Aspergillus californicus]
MDAVRSAMTKFSVRSSDRFSLQQSEDEGKGVDVGTKTQEGTRQDGKREDSRVVESELREKLIRICFVSLWNGGSRRAEPNPL